MWISHYTFLVLVWIIVQIGVIILVLIFLITLVTSLPDKDLAPEWEYLNRSQLKTGDILIISYVNLAGKIVHALTGSRWSHAGIVYIDPQTGLQYVLEGANYRQDGFRRNFFKIPLTKWIRINRYSTLSRMEINRQIDPKVLIQSFEGFRQYGQLDSLNPKWIRFLQTTPHKAYSNDDYNRGFTCIEACIRTLQNAGVFEAQKSESSYFLTQVMDSSLKTINGYAYSQARRLCLGRAYVRGVIP